MICAVHYDLVTDVKVNLQRPPFRAILLFFVDWPCHAQSNKNIKVLFIIREIKVILVGDL